MHVKPSQLVPGCVLLHDVIGKTNQPIIPKNTVLMEIHITILQKFLIPAVDISPILFEGMPFKPETIPIEDEKQKIPIKQIDQITISFFKDYLHVVTEYKKLFTNWQSGASIDMPYVRRLILPILDKLVDLGSAVFKLHHYVTKKDYIYHHHVSVGILSAYLARKMGYEKREWIQVGLAGFLSDCGMARIDQHIVEKEGALNPLEYKEIKSHPAHSYRLVEHIPTITQAVKFAVLQHHERLDGSGYPLGVSAEKTHKYGRIIAVGDMYHAMICERKYKEKMSPFRVIEEIQKEQFITLDHQVVQTFLKALANFSIGTRVELSNQQVAEIVFIEEKHPTRPIVRISGTNDIISLKDKHELFINEILDD